MYRKILKNTSIYGSVQAFQAFAALVRGKFISIFLGPSGMGVSALFVSVSETVRQVSSLGLNLAVTREVASEEDSARLSSLIGTARSLITYTSLLGFFICLLAAPLLSRTTFGNLSQWSGFILLGVGVGCSVAASGHLAILQGLQAVKGIARATIGATVCGLAVAVIMYWRLGVSGIVPAIVVSAALLFFFYNHTLNKILRQSGIVHDTSRIMHLTSIRTLLQDTRIRALLSLGIVLMAGDATAALVKYLVNIYINHSGSTVDVGLYQAAWSISFQYAAMILAAITMDYYPRLSRAANDNREMRKTVYTQMAVTSVIMVPAAIALWFAAPWVIRIVLTESFLSAVPLVRWMAVAIVFRALMLPLGYVSYAKGNRKVFFWLECVTCNLLTLVLTCGCYAYFGLIGLGYALVADNALCLLIYYIVNRRLYHI